MSSKSSQFIVDRLKSRLSRLKRSVITAGRLHEEEIQSQRIRITPWMITLTYAPGVEWSQLHITETIKSVRQWCERRGVKFRYVWVAEIQEKRKLKHGGHCLHYYIVVWLPGHLNLPKFDKRGWWCHGMTETVKARSPVGYLAKYASKGGKTNQFPKVARISGSGGLTAESRWQKSWWSMPIYVRERFDNFLHRPTRLKGGGFYSRLSGEIIDSLYEVVKLSPLIITPKQVFKYA
ncbi:MAG: hypothetical protein ABL933_02825 [Methyloglobulus sp.]|nr:hypothetical protein [Methyloglobulus sp.]